jgi:very-short-patch-repair endonuclease
LDERIAALAGTQYGVLTRRQLMALGASGQQIDHRRKTGRLVPLHRGVYALGHKVLRTEGHWLAAVLACGERAMLSHTAAAALWEIRPRPAGRIHVTTTRGGRKAPKGVVLHTTTAPKRTTHRGIPVTTPMRTLTDLATIVKPAALARAVEAAETRHLVDIRELERRPGLPALQAQFEPTTTKSDFEAEFVALCDRYHIQRPLTNHIVINDEVDAYFPDHHLIIECDSLEFHLTRRAFQEDRRRDADHLANGYRTLRFTYRQITDRSEWVAGIVKAALSRPRR